MMPPLPVNAETGEIVSTLSGLLEHYLHLPGQRLRQWNPIPNPKPEGMGSLPPLSHLKVCAVAIGSFLSFAT